MKRLSYSAADPHEPPMNLFQRVDTNELSRQSRLQCLPTSVGHNLRVTLSLTKLTVPRPTPKCQDWHRPHSPSRVAPGCGENAPAYRTATHQRRRGPTFAQATAPLDANTSKHSLP